MAFPFIFESNFEAGTNAEWDSETDTGSLLDFPHYSVLAGIPSIGPAAPYRGAYCMRVICGDTNDHTLIEGDIDIADTVTRYSSFYFYVSPDFVASADDIFNIYEVQGTVNAVENAISLQIIGATDAVTIGVGQTVAATFPASVSKGIWHHLELVSNIQTGGTGTANLWMDGVSVASVSTLTNTAVLRGVLGTQNTLATTTGTLLFDRFRFDDTQNYPDKERFPVTVPITKDGHVFIGPGWIDSAALLSASGTLVLYDTDTANVNSAEAVVDIDSTRGRIAFDGGAEFKRGCYADIATNARGEVRLFTGRDWRTGKYGPQAYSSVGALRNYGARRRPRPGNV